MAVLWMSACDQTGSEILDGGEGNTYLPGGILARTGDGAWKLQDDIPPTDASYVTKMVTTGGDTVFVFFGLYTYADQDFSCCILDSVGNIQYECKFKQTDWVTAEEWHQVIVKVKVADVGTVEVRIDGDIVIKDDAVDTQAMGTADIGGFKLWNTGSGYYAFIDDIVFADTAPGVISDWVAAVRIDSYLPTDETADMEWTVFPALSVAAEDIDEFEPDDAATYLYTSASGDKAVFTHSGLTDRSADHVIGAVAVNTWTLKDVALSGDIRPVVRMSYVDYPLEDIGVDISWSHNKQIMETRPDNGSAWTYTPANELAFGFQSVDVLPVNAVRVSAQYIEVLWLEGYPPPAEATMELSGGHLEWAEVSCFGRGDGVAWVGTTRGEVYEIRDDAMDDDGTAFEGTVRTAYSSTGSGQLRAWKAALDVFSQKGGAYTFNIYRDHDRTTPIFTRTATLPDAEAGDVLSNFFDRFNLNFNFRAIQFEMILTHGDSHMRFGPVRLEAMAIGGL